MNPSFMRPTQSVVQDATDKYLHTRYTNAFFQLKTALGLSHIPVTIPEHVLVCKAIVLLRRQFQQLEKLNLNQEKSRPWDYNHSHHQMHHHHQRRHSSSKSVRLSRQPRLYSTNLNSSVVVAVSSAAASAANGSFYNSETAKYYPNHHKRMIPIPNSSQFCPSIADNVLDGIDEECENDHEELLTVPPMDHINFDNVNCDTDELDIVLKQETEKLKFKTEESNTTTNSTTISHDLSTEWEDIVGSFDIDNDVIFDVPEFRSHFI